MPSITSANSTTIKTDATDSCPLLTARRLHRRNHIAASVRYSPVTSTTGGWYLRGDIGIGVQTFSEFDFTQTNSAFVWPSNWQIVQKDIQDTAIFGLGVGYVVNNWLRVDVTGEYRTEAAFKATGSYSGVANFCNPAFGGGVGTCFDVNSGNISSSVFMANAYVDLGTWWCLTPFIGAGVGGAYNRITGVQDNGINSSGFVGFGYTLNDNSAWSLAWNVQAGLTYNVSNNLKIDFSWRYLNLGSPQTAIVQCQNTPACPSAFYTLKDMTSQDFRIGFRWMIQPAAGTGVMAAQPVFAPQPEYEPPPVYAPQPPLSSRG
jgi:opacity protein-like surface antigen